LFENFNYVFVAEFLMFISSLKIPEVDGSSQIFMEVKKVESHLSLVVARLPIFSKKTKQRDKDQSLITHNTERVYRYLIHSHRFVRLPHNLLVDACDNRNTSEGRGRPWK